VKYKYGREIFVDSNVWIYLFASDDISKNIVASALEAECKKTFKRRFAA
jgi:predicted nucleic acid-binding protein